MTQPEGESAELKSRRVQRRIDAVLALPRPVREAGMRLLRIGPDGKQLSHKALSRSGDNLPLTQQLANLSPQELTSLFAAIFERLAPHVLAGWAFQLGLPYQISAHRRAFRAPRRPWLTGGRRLSWLQRMVTSFLPV